MTNKTLYKEYYGRVFQQGKNWKLTVQHHGIRRTFYSAMPGDRGRKECAKKAVAWRSQDTSLAYTDATTVDQLYQKFFEDKALEVDNIYDIKNMYNNHIKPVIGAIPVSSLTSQDMTRVINLAFKQRQLHKKTLKNIRGVMSCFCTWLDDSEIRSDLSTKKVRIPKRAVQGNKSILTADDLYILFHSEATVLNHQEVSDCWIYAYRFQVLFGLRPGELMGLEWADIDKDTIHVRRSINVKGKVTAGKNDYAQRDLPLTPMASEILSGQAKLRHNLSNPHERVFGELSQICYRNRWGVYCRHNNISYVTPYELRHTFASVNKLLPTWLLDEIMGHVHAGMSLGVYAHSLANDMDGIGKAIDDNLQKQLDYAEKRRVDLDASEI